MLSTIYGTEFGTQESIAWVICNNNPNYGPDIFEMPKPFAGKTGKIISDDRSQPCYDDHQICMQRMENYVADESGYVDFMSHYRKYEKDYENVIWANYYGRTTNELDLIRSDKLILCNTSFEESLFHYAVAFAFDELTAEDIDNHSEIWWFDHHHVDGVDTTRWKEYWYTHYHDKMKHAFATGELKYFWQLNYMHWDLHKALIGRYDIDPTNISITHKEDVQRIYDTRKQDYSAPLNQIAMHWESDANFLQVNDPDWTTQIEEIIDYLELQHTEQIYKNLQKLKEHITPKREWFEKTFLKSLS